MFQWVATVLRVHLATTAESERPVQMVSLGDLVMMAQKDQWETSAKSDRPDHVACPVMLAKRVFPVKTVSLA
jgi:hypothetical protein